MTRFTQLTPTMGLFAVFAAAMIPTAALAGEETRAVQAIAEARGKIDAGDKVGVGEMAPDLQGQAHQALSSAQDLLTNHHKVEALAAAQKAGELADQAMAVANGRKAQAASDRRSDASAAQAANQQAVMSADSRAAADKAATADANARAASAQAATDAANSRADAANQSSAAANAQMDAMRAAPTTTTVAMTQHDTVEHVAPAHVVHHPHHRVVHHHAPVAHGQTTTTEVTTTH